MTFANAPVQAVDSYKATVRGMSLKQLPEANRKSLPFEGAAEDFLTVAEMKKFSPRGVRHRLSGEAGRREVAMGSCHGGHQVLRTTPG